MAEGVDNAALRDAAIQGLREQILENATILYPKIVAEYKSKRSADVKSSEAFKIITVTQDDNSILPVLKLPGQAGLLTQAILLAEKSDGLAPQILMKGPDCANRMKALGGLLRVTEERLASRHKKLTRSINILARVKLDEGDSSARSGLVCQQHLDESVQHVTEYRMNW